MTNRLACIGIRVDDAETFGTTVEGLLAGGENDQGPGASSRTVWEDASGAGLVASLGPSGEVECVAPTFFGDTRLAVVARRAAQDPSCAYCDPLVVDVIDGDGGVLHPMAVMVDDLALTRPRLPIGQRAILACTAFAEALETFDDAASFAAWQQDHPVRHAAESAVPSGLLAGDGHETPEVLVSGTVLAAELRVNQATGSPFHRLSVRTLTGVLDVVAPVEALAAPPPPGAIVHGTMWMVGRIVEGLLPGPSPRPSRRFGLRRPEGRRR